MNLFSSSRCRGRGWYMYFVHVWFISLKLYHRLKNFIEFIPQNNLDLFKADASSDIWRAYVDYLDDMVLDGFFNCIHCSLNYLLENTDPKHNTTGLFEAKLELQQPEMVFIPSLDFGVSDGFYELVEGIVNDVYKMASLVKRLAEHNGSEHYQVKQTIRSKLYFIWNEEWFNISFWCWGWLCLFY